MSEFESEVELSVHIPSRELRQARSDIEDGIGSVQVGIDNGRATRPDGGVSAAGLAGGAVADELGEQTDLLEDIYDEIEGGGLGGGGGGGGGLGGGGLLAGLGLKSALGRVSGGGGLAALAAGNPVATGGLLGLGGAGALDVFGVDDGLESAGQDARQSLPFGEEIGDAANFLPGLSVAATLPELGSLDFDGAGEKFGQVFEQRSRVIQDVLGLEGNTSTFNEYRGADPSGEPIDEYESSLMRGFGTDVMNPNMPVDFSSGPSTGSAASMTPDTGIDIPSQDEIDAATNVTIPETPNTNVTVTNQIDASGSGQDISQQQVQELKKEMERVAQDILASDGVDTVSNTLQNGFDALFSG